MMLALVLIAILAVVAVGGLAVAVMAANKERMARRSSEES